MRAINFKPQFVVPCWIFFIAFVAAAFYFRDLADLFSVSGYFALSYGLIICLYSIICIYIKTEILAKGAFDGVIDLPNVYKALRVEIFFPKGSVSKDIGFMVGTIICFFIILPFAIYQKINGLHISSYIPLSLFVGISVYGQVRILFELGCSIYSKEHEGWEL
ncbi:hypothetical protein SAMN05216296_1374 [Pseudomonas pohangensis]|uniref:Uncharacterized protein n=1 Tax=Pseudomonas pohangensis TaxID=364197 RepID=A0A1H2F750_9PSED|nr:hypothetical protein [Pseudomonas pohangensis]SDU03147.1 hypothetical protein SAMN05216296_1374 [Pseudomonas pohangensis]